ncbi:MAG: metalloregulator ArsR/SmtB family transcription factor [Coriobacteriia bacterium]|nr:metalloregulator ArsR/SmtB family transcription factor [Coriobacteriia bacterium]
MRERGLVERLCVYSKAISEPNRMKMIKILGSHEPNTLNVSDIAGILKLSQPAATKHLKVMEQAGFFRRERKGTSVYYSLDEESIQEYHDLIDFAFAHSHTPCPNGFDCTTCPFEDTCV